MVVQLGSAYGKVVIDSSGATRGVKESSGALQSLSTVSKVAATAIGALSAEAVILKKAMDLGRQGGEVIQTTRAFDGLLESVGAAPDLLRQLQTASRGTVSDMRLMSSTATLLAGTSGDLATALAGATPELLEIAKAAQALNPSLGDTTFLYDSLARGIKRASPLILDNLGIVVKIGEANQRYADSIGKTVEALSSEERQIALLNEVLRSGQVLIEQAGGSAASATDDFDRLTATLENITNELKARLAPGLASAAGALELILTWDKRVNEALEEQRRRVEDTADNWDEYVDQVLAAEIAARRLSESEAQNVRDVIAAGRAVEEAEEKYGELTEAKIYDLIISGELSSAEGTLLAKQLDMADALDDVTRSLGLKTEAQFNDLRAVQAHGEALRGAGAKIRASQLEAAEAAEEFEQRTRDLNQAQRELIQSLEEVRQQKIEDFFDVDLGVGDVAAQLFDVVAFKEAGGEALEGYVNSVKQGLAENRLTPEDAKKFFESIAIEAAAIQVDIGNIDLEAAAQEISEQFNIPLEEARERIDNVIGGMDEINASDISEAMQRVEDLQQRTDELAKAEGYNIDIHADPGDVALKRITQLGEEIAAIEGVHEINWVITTTGQMPDLPTPPGGQHGLNMVVPPGYPNDTFPVLASSGERVLIIPQNKRAMLEAPAAGLGLMPVPGAGPGGAAGAAGGLVEVYQDSSIYQEVNQHFYDEGAAALGMAIVQTERMRQLDDSMGVG